MNKAPAVEDDYVEIECEKCEGTGKVDGNPVWHHGNYWKDTKGWCDECEGEGVIVKYVAGRGCWT